MPTRLKAMEFLEGLKPKTQKPANKAAGGANGLEAGTHLPSAVGT